MLKTIVKKGSYHDSVVLMLLTNQISSIEGVKKVSIMMATPANKDIYRQSGLSTSELEEASANDMVPYRLCQRPVVGSYTYPDLACW